MAFSHDLLGNVSFVQLQTRGNGLVAQVGEYTAVVAEQNSVEKLTIAKPKQFWTVKVRFVGLDKDKKVVAVRLELLEQVKMELDFFIVKPGTQHWVVGQNGEVEQFLGRDIPGLAYFANKRVLPDNGGAKYTRALRPGATFIEVSELSKTWKDWADVFASVRKLAPAATEDAIRAAFRSTFRSQAEKFDRIEDTCLAYAANGQFPEFLEFSWASTGLRAHEIILRSGDTLNEDKLHRFTGENIPDVLDVLDSWETTYEDGVYTTVRCVAREGTRFHIQNRKEDGTFWPSTWQTIVRQFNKSLSRQHQPVSRKMVRQLIRKEWSFTASQLDEATKSKAITVQPKAKILRSSRVHA